MHVLPYNDVLTSYFCLVYNLVFTLGFIIFCGSMGYMHRRSQCLMKVFPNPNVKQEDIVGEDGQITHNDVVKQYKTM